MTVTLPRIKFAFSNTKKMSILIKCLEEEIQLNKMSISDLKEEVERHVHTYKMFTKALKNESTPESLKGFMRDNRKKASEAAKKFEDIYKDLEKKNDELKEMLFEEILKRLDWLDLSW